MMFLRSFIKHGLLEAVGFQPDYWIILNAAGWMEKGVLTEPDLREIQETLSNRNGEETPTDEGEIPVDNEENEETPVDNEENEENLADGEEAPVEGNGNE